MTIFSFPQIVTDGLVLCLDAGNKLSYPGTGTTWTDLTRNKNNGALTNGPTFSNAGGGTIVFDGVNDYIYGTTQTPLPYGSSPRTIEVICTPRPSGTYNEQDIFSYGAELTGQRVNIVNTTSLISLALKGHNYGKSGLSLSGFNHISFIYPNNSTTSDQWLIYLNGTQLTGLTTIAGSTLSMNTASVNSFYMGTDITFYSYYSGKISNIKMYNRALTQNEVLRNYLATKGRFGL